MRIRWVRAEAFGAMTDKTLHLGEGLNVIVGPNDSGKSTWHAALFAALCGYPTPGDATTAQARADHRFRRDRQPRRQPGWSVEAEIELDEERRLLVQQNLLDPRTSTVKVPDDSAEIQDLDVLYYEGGIDVTRLIGLTRRSYAATAWVPQDRPMVFDDDASREELQRVISEYIGADDAGVACENIRTYRRWRIGSETDNASLLGQAAQTAAARRRTRDEAYALEANRGRLEEKLAQSRTNLTGLQRRYRVTEAITARLRERRVQEAVQRLRRDVEDLREQRARLVGDSTANQQSASVYKFPGYISDKDGPLAEAPAVGPGRASATDPLGVFGKRPETPDQPNVAAAPVEPAPPAPLTAAPGSSRDAAAAEALVAKPTEESPAETDGPHEDVTWEQSSGLGFVEGVVFPVLFFGGLVLAAIGLGLALIMSSLLAASLAVAAVMVAVGGFAVRLSVRRSRARLAVLSQPAVEDPFDKPEDDPTTEEDDPNLSTIVYTPPVEDVPVEEIDPVQLRRYDEQIAEKERQLRLMQQEHAQADEEADRQEYGLNPAELLPLSDNLDDALRARERAKDDFEQGQRAVAGAESELATLRRDSERYPALRDADAQVARAEADLVELRKKDRLLEEAVEHLTLAVAAAREKITDGVETRLREYLPEVTRNQHSMVDVDRGLRIRVGDQTQPMDDPTPGSRGTTEQTHLLRLVALGRHLGYGHEAGPLLLDDVTSNADSVRTPRILELLHRIAEQRQVVIFAHEDAVRDWALQRRTSDPRIQVLRLESVRKQPISFTVTVDEP